MKEKELVNAFETAGIFITEEQAEQFCTYYEMLTEKNKVMNLTAITEFSEVVQKHFIDSLMFGKLSWGEKAPEGVSVLDLGTGAGFPGIPLKIVYPEIQMVLADSLNKRIQFLKEVTETLGLKEISAVHGRAEDLAKKAEYRENFDLCISRAVANLSTLSEYCLPFVKLGGIFVSYKSGSIEEELDQAQKAIRILGGRVEKIEKFMLPDSEISRSLIIIRKEKNTPGKYPRKAGMPGKEPL